MRSVASLLSVLLLLAGGMGWYHFSDGQVQKRAARASLNQFADAVASKDRAKVSAALEQLLTPDAKVHLTVKFFSIGNTRPAMDEDFDKAQFIKFIDDILYTLTDYSYTPQLQSLDAKTGAVRFTSLDWADGANMMGGISVNMRYSSDTSCEGIAVFENKTAKLKEANCTLQFKQIPKPGQEGKFLNKQGLMDLLNK